MNIALLFGGKSFEHDISIITTNVIYHALKDKYDVFLMYIDKEGIIRSLEELDIDDITSNKKLKKASFIKNGIKIGIKKLKINALINLIHGINGEDGLAANICKLYDIPFVGCNNISSALCMDKYFSYAVLTSLCINVINTKQVFDKDYNMAQNFPIIVKPARLGSSIGIVKINDMTEMRSLLDQSFEFDNKVIIQQFIEKFKEYNQAAYMYKGEVILSNVEEVSKSDDILSFNDKYLLDTNKKHKKLEDEEMIKRISRITKKIYLELELSGVVRIDYMYFDNKFYVNEINTTPGSLAYYLFKEPIDKLMDNLIENALHEYQNQRQTNFSSSVLSKKYSYKK